MIFPDRSSGDLLVGGATLLDDPVTRIRAARRRRVDESGGGCRTVVRPEDRRLAWEDVHRVN